MSTKIESKPKFTIPRRSAAEWGEFFCQTAAGIIAARGGNGTSQTADNAIRTSASLTEALIELSENQ